MCPRHLTRTCATLAEAVQPRWTPATGVDASFGRPHFIALRWVRPSKGRVGSFWPAHRLNEPSTPDSALRGHDRVSVDLPSACGVRPSAIARAPNAPPHNGMGREIGRGRATPRHRLSSQIRVMQIRYDKSGMRITCCHRHEKSFFDETWYDPDLLLFVIA